MKWDCPYGEDEHSCVDFNCQGLFLCALEGKCLSFIDVCDGKADCNETSIDELFCEINPCPQACFCVGYAVQCIGKSLKAIPSLGRNARTLLITDNEISALQKSDFFSFLLHIDLSYNNLYSLKQAKSAFSEMTFLLYLDVAFCETRDLSKNVFLYQGKLKYLNITSNPIHSLYPSTFKGLLNINKFSLSNTSISKLCNFCLSGFLNLFYLDVSFNEIFFIEGLAFANLLHLKHLVLTNNNIKRYDISFLKTIPRGVQFETDLSRLCCQINKYLSAPCKEEQMYGKMCLHRNVVSLWYIYVAVAFILNMAGILQNLTGRRNVFTICVNNILFSQILLIFYYILRIFIRSITTVIVSGNLHYLCVVSSLILPLSQAVQVSLQFFHSVCHLFLTINDSLLPSLAKAYCVTVGLWIVSLGQCLLLHTGYVMQDTCIAYSLTSAHHGTLIYIFLIIAMSFASNVIIISTIKKANKVRATSERTISREEKWLRLRQIFHIILNSYHYALFGALYLIVSLQISTSQQLIILMDGIFLIKALSDPVLYIFTATSHWKKLLNKKRLKHPVHLLHTKKS